MADAREVKARFCQCCGIFFPAAEGIINNDHGLADEEDAFQCSKCEQIFESAEEAAECCKEKI